MQWSPSLLFLLGAVAVEPLTCHFRQRYATTVAGLQNATYKNPIGSNTQKNTCSGSWTACARWLIKGNQDSWADYYGGCYKEVDAKDYPTTQMVQKYCADPNNVTCVSTLMFGNIGKHQPALLCCCFDDLCNATELIAFAEQHPLTTSTHKPPRGPVQNVTCAVSVSNATTQDGLLDAEPQNATSEQCTAAWAPCVEFVYTDVQGLWQWWRAGCSYKYSGISYEDVVGSFCTASSACEKFDMIEPTTRALGEGFFVYTQAYGCCCSGTGCTMPNTVAFSKGVAQTTKLSTAATSPPTTKLSSAAPRWGGHASASASASAASEQPAKTSAAPVPSGFPVWLLIIIIAVALLAIVLFIVCAVVCARRRAKKASGDGAAPVMLDDATLGLAQPPTADDKPPPSTKEAASNKADAEKQGEGKGDGATGDGATDVGALTGGGATGGGGSLSDTQQSSEAAAADKESQDGDGQQLSADAQSSALESTAVESLAAAPRKQRATPKPQQTSPSPSEGSRSQKTARTLKSMSAAPK